MILEYKILRLQIAMNNLVLMEMLYSREHFPHQDRSSSLTEASIVHNGFKEFSAFGKLHNNMNIFVIDIRLMKLYDVRVVNLLKDGEFFFQQGYVLFNIGSQYALHGVLDIGLLYSMREPHCPKVATTHKLLKFVHLTHICVRIVILNIFESFFSWT